MEEGGEDDHVVFFWGMKLVKVVGVKGGGFWDDGWSV